ncbi:MAG TPA: glycosyltransferase family 4 protein [Gaiellaceae bacterium]|nr:glycosyltransferase family 4 protein [Gaiellaceae bacterium]
MSARVLVLAGESPLPPSSGLRQRILHLTRALAAELDVELAALGDVPPGSSEPFAIHSVRHRVSRRRALAGSLRQPYQAAKVRSRALRRLAATGGWTSIQAELPFVAPAAGSHSALVLDAHNVETDVLRTLAAVDERPLHRLRWRWEAAKTERFERAVLARAQAVCATSDEDASALERLGARNLLVVPNGVACASVEHRPPAASAELCYVGHFGYRPNQLAAVELVDAVLPRVRAELPAATVTLVGREPGADLARRVGGGVTLAADVPDVLPYLHRARALVVPLRSGSGTRLKVLEALAAGVPVVSTSFGVAGLDVRDGHDVLIGDTPADLAAQAVRVLSDDGLAAGLSESGRRLVERRYDWPVIARPLVELHAGLAKAG